MEQKINIAEILKDCPQGMELDCTMFENVTFEGIEDVGYINILIKTPNGQMKLSKYGCFIHSCEKAKCVIFPKGKTTWEGFVPPCKFKDGDIIFTNTNALKFNLENSWVSIFKEYRNNRCACYICLCLSDLELYHDKFEDELLCELCEIEENRLATEEEKQKLFDAIKANGYKWNAETKTLEELVEPIFEAGNKIEKCGYRFTIAEVKDDYYLTKCGNKIPIDNQDDFSLVPDKFDITTLIPFESRVLVRDTDTGAWRGAFYSHYKSNKFYTIGNIYYYQCIPYEGNEHLLEKKDDCDEYYKTW